MAEGQDLAELAAHPRQHFAVVVRSLCDCSLRAPQSEYQQGHIAPAARLGVRDLPAPP